MQKHNDLVNNFSGGQVDERVRDKFNTGILRKSVSIMSNFITNVMGNAKYMPGFRYLAGTANNSKAYFIEFSFNKEQSYMIEATPLVFRFVTYDALGQIGYIPGPYEVVTPYTADDLPLLKYVRDKDTMYIVCPGKIPKKLVRTSATTFTLSDVVLEPTGDLEFVAGANFIGYPAAIAFFEGRLFYSGFDDEPTRVWGSKAGLYDDFTEGTNPDDALQYNSGEISDSVQWLFAGNNSLTPGTQGGLTAINGYNRESLAPDVLPYIRKVNSYGADQSSPIKKDELMLFIENTRRRIRSFSYDAITENWATPDINILSLETTQSGISQLTYKIDQDNLIYAIRDDGKLVWGLYDPSQNAVGFGTRDTEGDFQSVGSFFAPDGTKTLIVCVLRDGDYFVEYLADEIVFTKRDSIFTDDKETDDTSFYRMIGEDLAQCVYLDSSKFYDNLQEIDITYSPGAGTITAASPVFSSDSVGHRIVYKTKTGVEFGVFKITAYTSTTVVDVELLSESVSSNTYDQWYLTTNTFTGLSHLEGKEVSIVGNGGYIGEETVSSGEVTVNAELNTACIGYKYLGVIKSLNLVLQESIETFVNNKNIISATIDFLNSAGGEYGSSQYDLNEIQKFNPQGLFDSPPLPMNSNEKLVFKDGYRNKKHYYIVQPLPLPMTILAVTMKVNYNTNRNT
jgi:hypothetical protein